MLTRPSLLLRAEGGIVFGASLLLYAELQASWLLFVVLVLMPDISMLGYFMGVRLGAALYNLVIRAGGSPAAHRAFHLL